MSTEKWPLPQERAGRQRAEGRTDWKGEVQWFFIHSRLLLWGGVWSPFRPEVSLRNPGASQPSPYGSCSPRAGALRIGPPAKGQTTAGRGRGVGSGSQGWEEPGWGGRRVAACHSMALRQQAQDPGHGLGRKGTSPGEGGRGRNEAARLRNVAVGRKTQPWDGERAGSGRNVAAKYSRSRRAEERGDR